MPMLPTRVIRYGADEPLPERLPLRAGPLALIYENGDLRSIRLGEHEIIRRIYVAVRDQNWGTIAPRLSDIRIAIADTSFQISYEASHRQGNIDFAWHGWINGGADGTIRFTMDGAARTTFLRNRIGFCILHPPRCAGAAVRLEHVDGAVENTQFPRLIAPQYTVDGIIQPVSPFNELRSISHAIGDDLWATVRLEGEIFEMEDQRNWIDGSFKTYGPPLRLPFPAEIAAGARVVQAVTLAVAGAHAKASHIIRSAPAAPVSFSIDSAAKPTRMPRLGLGEASHGAPLTPYELKRLRALQLAHLRVDLRPADGDYAERLWRAANEARAIGAKLEIALHLSGEAERELRELLPLLNKIQPDIAAWLIFSTLQPTTNAGLAPLARAYLSRFNPVTPIGGGTNIYFTDLNRAPRLPENLDLICYSVNPQVHAFDNYSLIETCATIAATVESAAALASNRPIAVTPITLKPRFNPVAIGAISAPAPGELPDTVDVRQMSLLGAGWTLACLKYLAESGVASATLFETSGWRGIMETATGAALPELFHSIPDAVFPIYHVLADVAEFKGGTVIRTQSSDTLRVDGLALTNAGDRRLVFANLTDEAQSVIVSGLGARARLQLLDETNAERAMRQPEQFRAEPGITLDSVDGVAQVMLRPYAIARLDTADVRASS